MDTQGNIRSAVSDISLEVRGEVCAQHSVSGFYRQVSGKP